MKPYKFVVYANAQRAEALLTGQYLFRGNVLWLDACELTAGLYEGANYHLRLCQVQFYYGQSLPDPLRIDAEVFMNHLEYGIIFDSVEECLKLRALISTAAATFGCDAVFPDEGPEAGSREISAEILFDLIGVDPPLGDLLEAIAQAYRP